MKGREGLGGPRGGGLPWVKGGVSIYHTSYTCVPLLVRGMNNYLAYLAMTLSLDMMVFFSMLFFQAFAFWGEPMITLEDFRALTLFVCLGNSICIYRLPCGIVCFYFI